MSLGVFVAGAYNTLFADLSIGLTRDGYKLTCQSKVKRIDRSDAYLGTLIDILNDGADWSLMCDSLEYKAAPLAILTQFSSGSLGRLGPLGTPGSTVGEQFTMTVTPGTAAANNGDAINTLTAMLAVIAPNADIPLLFDSTLREFPIKLQFLPSFTTGGVVRHFSTT